jgi:hypothetical protein
LAIFEQALLKSECVPGKDCDYPVQQTEHIHGDLWHRYSVTVNMMVTIKLSEVMTSKAKKKKPVSANML